MAELSLALHGLALVLGLTLLVDRLRSAGLRWGRVLAGGAVLLLVVGGEIDFPQMVAVTGAEEISVLNEGGTEQNINQIFGAGVHAGPMFRALRMVAPGEGAPDLRYVVRVNRWLSAVGNLLFPFVAWALSGSFLIALILGWLNVGGILAWHHGLSELPAALLMVQFWLGALAAWCLDQGLAARAAGRALPGWRMVVAGGLLLLITALAAGTRPELAGLGLVALVVLGLRLGLGDARLARVDAWPGAALAALRRSWVALGLAAGILAAGLGVLYLSRRIPVLEIQWVVTGLNPLHLGIIQLPILVSMVLPLGVSVLMVLGFIYGLRRWRSLLGLPIAVLLLWGIYHRASHSAFREAFRYLNLLSAPLLLFAGLGWRELRGLGQRREWSTGWERPALLGLILLMLVPPLHGREALFGLPRAETEGYRAVGIFMDVQEEVRTLLDLRDRYPDCLFIAPVTRSRGGGQRGRALRLSVFRTDWVGPKQLGGEDGLDEALRQGGDPSCALLYLGLDCNLEEGDGCGGFLAPGMELLEERVFPAAGYNDALEYGRTVPEVRLQVYRLESTDGRSREVE